MACPSQPPRRFDTKVESQIQHSEKPADSVNPENALLFNLVDEVWDDGHALVVKNGGRDERIAFTDIKNVNYSPFVNPPRITLSLRRQTSFGDQITFCAPVRFIPLTTSPVVTALIDRIDQERRKRV
jgi:hypothetical protein